jgi:hypothetical protein
LALAPRVSDSIARYPEEPCFSVLDTARRSIRQDQLDKQILREIVDILPSCSIAPQPSA